MIRATEADRAEIEALLTPVAEYAMFPLNNLARYGMNGGHPFAVTMWVARREGAICDVLTQTDGGMVMPYLPSARHDAARVLRGRAVSGIVGVKGMVRGIAAALRLQGPASLDHDEPHFVLDRADLRIPGGPGKLVPMVDAPAEVIKVWMLDYQLATLNTPPDQAAGRVRDSYDQYTALGSHVVLMDEGQPLAMTGFNAQLPHIVQIGGVYVPPDLRGRGHARRAVALHVAASGAGRATLFSASEMAVRAYRAIGFRVIGEWTLLLLRAKEMVR